MRTILLILVTVLFKHIAVAQSSVYTQQVKDIDGNNMQLASYSTRKVMFLVLPGNDADTAFAGKLARFREQWQDKIYVIGIMLREAGNTAAKKDALKALYGRQMIFTEELHEQSPLIRWITDKELNGHYDRPAKEGTMFIVSQMGELFAVLGQEVSLDAPVMERIINADIK